MEQKPFTFGLERVRELRARDEDRAREAFAVSLSERGRGAARLDAAASRLAAAHEAGRGDGIVVEANEMLRRQAWVERLERHADDAKLALSALDVELSQSRVVLADAGRRREVMDRLRERHLAEHKAESARREGLWLDELATQAHVRRSAA